MSKYLLTCGCGSTATVDVGQAGGQVDCPSCGAQLDVPHLRKLRHLPITSVGAEHVPSTWGTRQGVATAGLILAAVLASAALWNRFSEPIIPEFNAATRLQNVDQALETMTPAQGWQMWIELYRPLAERGFAKLEDPHKPAIEQYIAKRRFFQKILLVAAAVCAAVALATIIWPRPTHRRLAATR